MKLDLLETQEALATENMEMDAKLLADLQYKPKALLHLYAWKRPSITHGYFLKVDSFLNIDGIQKHGIDLARRPTGGGITMHLSDLAFSILIPSMHPWYSTNTLDCYHQVNQRVQQAFASCFGPDLDLDFAQPQKPSALAGQFCMAKPTKYDIMIEGKKIAGAAQRKTKFGFLHQGSILLGQLPKQFLDEIILQKEIAQAIIDESTGPLGFDWTQADLKQARKQIKQALVEVFCG